MPARLIAPLPLLPFLIAATTVAAEPIAQTCALHAAPDVCACASARLGTRLSPGDLALYAIAAGEVFALQAQGEALVPAWEAATQKAAAAAGLSAKAARDRLNDAGAAHRAAITACEG